MKLTMFSYEKVIMMMIMSVTFLLLLVVPGVISFQPNFQHTKHSPLSHLTRLNSSKDRIVKAGCGIPTIPSGNCLLFDPELEGKLQGTGSLSSRIHNSANYILPPDAVIVTTVQDGDSLPSDVTLMEAQDWLEEYTNDNLPLNFAKPANPVTATLLGRTRIIAPDAPGDIQHLIMRLPDGMHYVEGQSISIIPPGIDSKTNKKYSPRLYSIASTRYGDLLDGNTVSLCVRRAEYYDPVTNEIDPSKKGICSNFLCDASPGTQIQVAGPVGKTMLLPNNPKDDVIMIATGTGIAPFRGFLHRLFMEQTVSRHVFDGMAWLVLGVPTSGGLLYKEELDAMIQNGENDAGMTFFCYLSCIFLTMICFLLFQLGQGQLKVDYAISREMTNTIDGGKLYVQHVIAQNADEFFSRVDNGASVYFCGLKGMMPPILETLEKVADAKGLNWNEKMKSWKDNHQWHVEVY